MEQAIFAVKSKKERTDYARATGVTKSTNNAVGRADSLYFHHGCAFARGIRGIQAFRDNTIKVAADSFKPFTGSPVIGRCR
jgi:hypothetical protein